MKHLLLFALLIFICLVPVAIWNQRNERRRGFQHFKKFNKANIEGVLLYVKLAYKGIAFRITGDTEEYVFYPYTNKELNNSSIFGYTATIGDSVIKPAYSDTLKLIKGNEVLKYTFAKFEK